MAEEAAAEQPKPESPLPRLKSLVVARWNEVSEKAPLDLRLFGFIFTCTFAVLLASAVFLPPLFLKPAALKSGADTRISLTATGKTKTEKTSEPWVPRIYSEREKQAIATNDRLGNESLSPAPIPALEEPFGQGGIPRIAPDGRTPWYLYSRPFDKNDPRPRVSIVVAGLGMSRIISDAAITELPGAVTLAFTTDSPAAGAWMDRARTHGHETLLSLPMEPLDYPASDPGPGTLLLKNSQKENMERLKIAMAKGHGYVGVTTFTGSRLTSSPDQIKYILKEIASRGLFFLDARLTPLSNAFTLTRQLAMPGAEASYALTADMGQSDVRAMLTKITANAPQDKKATVVVYPTPLIIRELINWTNGIDKNRMVLTPITAMAE